MWDSDSAVVGAERADRAMGELEQAIERCNKAEGQIGHWLATLAERLQPVLRPEAPQQTDVDARLEAVGRQPSQVVERLWSHADALERQARRMASICERLDT